MQPGALIVNRVGGGDDKWTDTQKLNLTYCVSNDFGTIQGAVVDAIAQATTAAGRRAAHVNFVYVPAQDGNCTTRNNNVVFNVRQVSTSRTSRARSSRATARSSRDVLVDTRRSATPAAGRSPHILGHELGHTLGFRHEHTRPEAGTCFEDNNWRAAHAVRLGVDHALPAVQRRRRTI